jgi:hypothetical protein
MTRYVLIWRMNRDAGPTWTTTVIICSQYVRGRQWYVWLWSTANKRVSKHVTEINTCTCVRFIRHRWHAYIASTVSQINPVSWVIVCLIDPIGKLYCCSGHCDALNTDKSAVRSHVSRQTSRFRLASDQTINQPWWCPPTRQEPLTLSAEHTAKCILSLSDR